MNNNDWRIKYQEKIKRPEQALEVIQPRDRIFIGSACGTPQKLVKALADRPVEDIEVTHILTLGVAPYAEEALAQRYRANSFFISANVREAVQKGRGDYTRIFLSELLQFRAELLKQAKQRNFVYQDQPEESLVAVRYPEEFETKVKLSDGNTIFIRPIKPTDEPAMRELFYSFSPNTVFYHYFSYIKAMPHEKAN